MLLLLHQLIAFSDEFSQFFAGDPPEIVEARGCVYNPAHPTIQVEESSRGGWILFRKEGDFGDTYLLVETEEAGRVWKSWFAPDPKSTIAYLKTDSSFPNWDTLLPLIRLAHKEAHPSNDETPNLRYLQDRLSEALHGTSPGGTMRSLADQASVGISSGTGG